MNINPSISYDVKKRNITFIPSVGNKFANNRGTTPETKNRIPVITATPLGGKTSEK